jgi:hypothetical protein
VRFTASLKRCADTNHQFFRNLRSRTVAQTRFFSGSLE